MERLPAYEKRDDAWPTTLVLFGVADSGFTFIRTDPWFCWLQLLVEEHPEKYHEPTV